MRYLLLIYTAETPDQPPEEAMNAELAEYDRFTQDLKARGVFHAGEALHPTSAATTVRIEDDRTIATDGPFAETKEALGGFYMIDAADLDEAIVLAARIPAARHGCVEVRPIFEFGAEMGASVPEAVAAD